MSFTTLRSRSLAGEIRFGLTSSPTFTSTYIGVDIQGMFVACRVCMIHKRQSCFAADIVLESNPVTPPITPPNLPPFDSAAASYYIQVCLFHTHPLNHWDAVLPLLQILVSSYTPETGLYTLYEAGLLHWMVRYARTACLRSVCYVCRCIANVAERRPSSLGAQQHKWLQPHRP